MANHHVSQILAAYEAAYESGAAEQLDRLYELDGVLVPQPGHGVTGTDRLGAIQHVLGFGGSIRSKLRHAYVVDEIALLIVDWSIEGTGPDGAEVRIDGTATDVVRRGPDGRWRYVIDNPFGTAG